MHKMSGTINVMMSNAKDKMIDENPTLTANYCQKSTQNHCKFLYGAMLESDLWTS